MKIRFYSLAFLITISYCVVAGTPSIGGTSIIYGIVIFVFLSILGIEFFISFFKKNKHKIQEFLKSVFQFH